MTAWAGNDAVINTTFDLGEQIGCNRTTSKELKSCMKTKSVEELWDAAAKIGKARYGLNMLKYHPRIDSEFFPKGYPELIKEAPPKPALIGFTNAESAYFSMLR